MGSCHFKWQIKYPQYSESFNSYVYIPRAFSSLHLSLPLQQKQEACIVGTQHNLSTTRCELVGMYIHTYLYMLMTPLLLILPQLLVLFGLCRSCMCIQYIQYFLTIYMHIYRLHMEMYATMPLVIQNVLTLLSGSHHQSLSSLERKHGVTKCYKKYIRMIQL